MTNGNMTNSLTTALLALGFAALFPTPKAFGVVPPPDGFYPDSPRQKGKTLFLALLPALQTPQLVGARCLAIPSAASTRVSARERSC